MICKMPRACSADGNYQVTIMTKAKLAYNGTVEWAPPAVYKRCANFLKNVTKFY